MAFFIQVLFQSRRWKSPFKTVFTNNFPWHQGDISSISPISLGFGVAYLNIAYSGVQGVQSQVLRGTKVFTRNVSTWYGPLYWYSDELNISPLNLQASFFQSLQRILLRSLRRFSKPITRWIVMFGSILVESSTLHKFHDGFIDILLQHAARGRYSTLCVFYFIGGASDKWLVHAVVAKCPNVVKLTWPSRRNIEQRLFAAVQNMKSQCDEREICKKIFIRCGVELTVHTSKFEDTYMDSVSPPQTKSEELVTTLPQRQRSTERSISTILALYHWGY